MAKNNCHEFGLTLSKRETILTGNEKEKVGALYRNFIEHSWFSHPGYEPLHCFKNGNIGFMRGLANDVASDGITVNAVLPVLINTPATASQTDEKNGLLGNTKQSSD
jgi:NAD(P)-dependent dehydrogenase (short-subunit alcohol dehydrogenase family)